MSKMPKQIPINHNKKASQKAQLLNEIKQGLKEVRKIREGRAKVYYISDLLGGK